MPLDARAPQAYEDIDARSDILGSTSFYELNMIVSGICVALACVVACIHLSRFATHLSNPGEQVKYEAPPESFYPVTVLISLPQTPRIMRVFTLIPLYSVLSFLSICVPRAMVYLHPWLDVFQSQALVSFFLLMCEFVAPTHDQRDIFFAALPTRDKKSPQGRRDNLGWYRVSAPASRCH